MLKNYFVSACRGFWKNKATALINVTGLSVGMAAAVLIFLWVTNERNYDNYHKDADRIYRLTTNLKVYNWIWETSPLLLADAVKKEVPEVEEAARLYHGNMPVFNIGNNIFNERNCAYVDEGWFNMFHYDFIQGDAASFSRDPNSIILTASEAKKYFGKLDIIGSVIRADSMNLVVKGIVEDAPANSSFQYASFIPMANMLKDADRRANDERWENANYITFIKAKAGTGENALAGKITAVFASHSGDRETTISLEALKRMHFESDIPNSVFTHGNKNAVSIFTFLAILLLCIACINYVNLTTAKANLRSKEVGVRKMIGASRLSLFYQFLAEAFLVSCVALLATLLLIYISMPAFNAVTDKHFQLSLTSVALWRIIGITLFAAFILNSVYPALVLSSFKPLNVFRGVTVLRLKDSYLRKVLVTFQFTISVMLIAGVIIIYRQMQFIQQTDPGYNRQQTMVAYLPANVTFEKKDEMIALVKRQLLTSSSIQNVAMANQSIVDIGSSSTGAADWDGHDTSFNPKIAQLSADENFAGTMGLQMAEGRWFSKGSDADKDNVILNETAVKELRIHKPYVGQRFTWKGTEGQIIGVVKDFKYKSLHDKTGPLVVFQNPAWYRSFMINVAPGNTARAIQVLRDTWKQFMPGSPLEYDFLDESFARLYKTDQQTSALILAFAIIAVAISCLGLFGLTAFTAERRAKEIGIRKVLGASVAGITQLLTKDFLKLVLIAIVIASPLAWWATGKWLQEFAYRISISWWMFVMAGFFAVTIAVITISFQAIKAAVANPVRSLRTE